MNVEIAERLAARRKQAGLSQEALAEQLGVSRQAVSKWERSESSPDTDNLISLAKLYGVSLDELLYVDGSIEDDVAFEAADRAAARKAAEANAGAGVASGTPGATDASSGTAANPDGGATPAAEGAAAATGKKPSNVHIGLDGIHVLDGDDYVHVSWSEGVHVSDSKKGDEVHVGWSGVQVHEGVAAPASAAAAGAAAGVTGAAAAGTPAPDTVTVDGSGVTATDDDGTTVQWSTDGVVVNGTQYRNWDEAHKAQAWGPYNEPCGYTVNGEWFDSLKDAREKYGEGVGNSIPVKKHYLNAAGRVWMKFPFPLVVLVAYLLIAIFLNAWGMALFLVFTVPLYYMLGHLIGTGRIGPFVAGAYPVCTVAWFFYMAFVQNAWHPAWAIFLTIPVVECLVVWATRTWRAHRRKEEVIEVEAEANSSGADVK